MSLKQFILFTSDAGALEKILRLLQSIFQVLATWALAAEDVKMWLLLRRQFALGRRYIRFFRWIDCLSRAYTVFNEEQGLGAVLGVGKWSCMAAFLFLESVGILDVMGVWQTEWAKQCLIEANKFWFYALVFSMAWGLMQLSALNRSLNDTLSLGKGKEKEEASSDEVTAAQKNAEAKTRYQRAGLRRRFVVDALDLLIPGHVVGWLPTSAAMTGIAGSVSTVLSMKDIWDKVNDH